MNPRLLVVAAALVGAGVLGFYVVDRWPIPPTVEALDKPALPQVVASGESQRAAPEEKAPTPSAPTGRPALHPRADEFAFLTALQATPEMLSTAFDIYRECKTEAQAEAGSKNGYVGKACGLAPGQPDNPTMVRMLEARVQRADFGAYADLWGHRVAFADDPARWRRLEVEAYRIGMASGEPSVMRAEAAVLREKGDAAHAAGHLGEAQAAYKQAATYAAASAIGNARVAGKKNVDLFTDDKFAAVASKLAEPDRVEAIQAGTTLANRWKRKS